MKKIPCISIKQAKYNMVMFALSAKELNKLVEVNRREEGKKDTYQRSLLSTRIDSIARFIDGGNAIPTNIVIALDDGKATLAANGQSIQIATGGGAGWVIDGQHRLNGAAVAQQEIMLCVTAFLGLSVPEQINQFVTINKEAKKVPTSLYLDLLPDLNITKTIADQANERAVDIAESLKCDEMGPFYNKIVSLKSPGKGELSLTQFVRKVAKLVHKTHGVLRNAGEPNQTKLIANFYNALKDVFPSEYNNSNSIFFRTIGFGAMLNAFPTVYNETLKRTGKKATRSELSQTLKNIEDFAFADWSQMGTGSAAEILAGKAICDRLNEVLGVEGESTDQIEV